MSAPRSTATFTHPSVTEQDGRPLRVRLVVDVTSVELLELRDALQERRMAPVYHALACLVVGWNHCHVDPTSGRFEPVLPPSVVGVGALLTVPIDTVIWLARMIGEGAQRLHGQKPPLSFADSIVALKARIAARDIANVIV